VDDTFHVLSVTVRSSMVRVTRADEPDDYTDFVRSVIISKILSRNGSTFSPAICVNSALDDRFKNDSVDDRLNTALLKIIYGVGGVCKVVFMFER